ncbi:MAG: AAA family ATPase [Methylobacter sp.]
MLTLTNEEKLKILEPLEEYYANSPKQFSLGLQNFQSIREYTKIPLAPITLIYGQNSAGKSAIHDGLIFLSEFLRNGKVPGVLAPIEN